MKRKMQTMDGNTAAAYISYAFTDVAAIFPITPSSNMAESVDEWAVQGRKNLFGQMVEYRELMTHHENYHVCAGEILIEHKLGNVVTASDKLRRQFTPLTEKLHAGIVRLHSASRK